MKISTFDIYLTEVSLVGSKSTDASTQNLGEENGDETHNLSASDCDMPCHAVVDISHQNEVPPNMDGMLTIAEIHPSIVDTCLS